MKKHITQALEDTVLTYYHKKQSMRDSVVCCGVVYMTFHAVKTEEIDVRLDVFYVSTTFNNYVDETTNNNKNITISTQLNSELEFTHKDTMSKVHQLRDQTW